MRWGLIPHWAKEERIGYKMINARSETVDSKPAFRQPFKRHRCLIPANGFYEWRKTQSGKMPYYIRLKDGPVMGFAGLWDILVINRCKDGGLQPWEIRLDHLY
jgi:putative SOS response-associated peptidase YedK